MYPHFKTDKFTKILKLRLVYYDILDFNTSRFGRLVSNWLVEYDPICDVARY